MQMHQPPFNTSLTGYVSGSIDKQNDLYRNRQRPQPHPLVHEDSGYESAPHVRLSNLARSNATSLLDLANALHSFDLLENKSNFSGETSIEYYEATSSVISESSLTPSTIDSMRSTRPKLIWKQGNSI